MGRGEGGSGGGVSQDRVVAAELEAELQGRWVERRGWATR